TTSKFRKAVVIFADFPINEKTGSSLVMVHPWLHQCDDFPTFEIASQDWTVKQIAPHNSMGGVGSVAWRMRSKASASSSQAKSRHAPARLLPFSRVLFVLAFAISSKGSVSTSSCAATSSWTSGGSCSIRES